MKTEQEIRGKLAEISAKIDRIYLNIKIGSKTEKECDALLHVLQTREDMLECVLES